MSDEIETSPVVGFASDVAQEEWERREQKLRDLAEAASRPAANAPVVAPDMPVGAASDKNAEELLRRAEKLKRLGQPADDVQAP